MNDNSAHMWWSVLDNLGKLSSSDPVQTNWKEGEDVDDVDHVGLDDEEDGDDVY